MVYVVDVGFERERHRLPAQRGEGIAVLILGGGGCGRPLLGLDLAVAAEFDDQLVGARIVEGAAVAREGDEIGQHVGGAQHRLHHGGGRLKLAGADAVERRLEHVRELHELVELEGARAAFDGMHRAENRVDGLIVGGPVLHRQESGLQLA